MLDILHGLQQIASNQTVTTATITQLAAQLAPAIVDIHTISEKVVLLETELKDVQTKVTNIDTNLGTVKTDVDSIKLDATQLRNDVSVIRGDVNTIMTDVSDSVTYLATIDETLTLIDTSVDLLQTTTTAIEGSLATVEASVVSIEALDTSIEATVAEMALDLTELSASVDALLIAVGGIYALDVTFDTQWTLFYSAAVGTGIVPPGSGLNVELVSISSGGIADLARPVYPTNLREISSTAESVLGSIEYKAKVGNDQTPFQVTVENTVPFPTTLDVTVTNDDAHPVPTASNIIGIDGVLPVLTTFFKTEASPIQTHVTNASLPIAFPDVVKVDLEQVNGAAHDQQNPLFVRPMITNRNFPDNPLAPLGGTVQGSGATRVASTSVTGVGWLNTAVVPITQDTTASAFRTVVQGINLPDAGGAGHPILSTPANGQWTLPTHTIGIDVMPAGGVGPMKSLQGSSDTPAPNLVQLITTDGYSSRIQSSSGRTGYQVFNDPDT